MSPDNNDRILITRQGETFRRPVHLGDLDLYTVQKDYGLSLADFIHLKKGSHWTEGVVPIFLGSFVGYGLVMLGKVIHCGYLVARGAKPGSSTGIIDKWEFWILGISGLSTLGMYLWSYWAKSDRKEVIQRIERHFEKNPRVSRIRERE